MNRGFTIIEMLVATAIFAIVMVLALSSLLNVNDLLARAEAFREANDNFNFALEAMMRDIRTGSGYPANGVMTELAFTPSHKCMQTITYRLNNKAIERKSEKKNKWDDYNSQWGSKFGGLPFQMYVYARHLGELQDVGTAADRELRYISSLLFKDGEPVLSQLTAFSMMSYAEKLSPGALYRKSK